MDILSVKSILAFMNIAMLLVSCGSKRPPSSLPGDADPKTDPAKNPVVDEPVTPTEIIDWPHLFTLDSVTNCRTAAPSKDIATTFKMEAGKYFFKPIGGGVNFSSTEESWNWAFYYILGDVKSSVFKVSAESSDPLPSETEAFDRAKVYSFPFTIEEGKEKIHFWIQDENCADNKGSLKFNIEKK